MDIKYNKQKLASALEDVYNLLGVPISIFDHDFHFVTSYPPNGYLTDFCKMIRAVPERAAKCHLSDEKACATCKRENRTYSYLCHAGVRETITPIRFENLIIGYIMFGEYRKNGEATDVTGYAQRNGIDVFAIKKAYEGLHTLDEKEVQATCNILESCVLKFWLTDAILLSENDIADRVKRFINDNLHEPLTAEYICKSLLIDRRQLYSVFRSSYSTSVKQYVLSKKISRAKTLLISSEYSITEISEKCGFPDYNNFIQRFKSITGTTPLRYRKEYSQREDQSTESAIF